MTTITVSDEMATRLQDLANSENVQIDELLEKVFFISNSEQSESKSKFGFFGLLESDDSTIAKRVDEVLDSIE